MDIDTEKLQYLFGFSDEYFDILINKVLDKKSDVSEYSAAKVYNMITYYIEAENKLGTKLPFKDVKTYFLYNLNSRYEYFKFKLYALKESGYKNIIKLNLGDNEKICYLLSFMEDYICILINEVLTDSKTDPDYSAVAATNVIKCYIEIENQAGVELPFCNAETFFKEKNYTRGDYIQFEESRKSESEYYRSVQY